MTAIEKILKYVKENYGSEPEYLWKKFPKYAVLRNKRNSKWYGILMNIPIKKLGIESDKNIDILNIKCDPIMIGSLIDNKRYFPAYHMNKEHWITLFIDKIPQKEIFGLIDLSFEIVKNKNKHKKKLLL